MSRVFLLDEDRALRNLLLGITVDDQKQDAQATPTPAPRRVGVWFGGPDIEIRNQSYPFITIDLLHLRRATDREHRGLAAPDYDRPANVAAGAWEIDYPIPMDLIYQITTYARQPNHDRQIMAALINGRIPMRFGTLCPDDGTVRRLDVIEVVPRPTTEQGKRLFRNAITISVSSELPPVTSDTYQQVTDRFLTLGLTLPALPGTP